MFRFFHIKFILDVKTPTFNELQINVYNSPLATKKIVSLPANFLNIKNRII